MDGARGWRRRQDLPYRQLPVDALLSVCYNVMKPDFGPNWQIRAQVQLMVPK